MPIVGDVVSCICNVVISCWKSGAYDFVICRGGTDMCFVPGSGWKHLDLEQYRISGLTRFLFDKFPRTYVFIALQSPATDNSVWIITSTSRSRNHISLVLKHRIVPMLLSPYAFA